MAQYVCPKVVYFNYFTSVFSSLFFPSHNLIMSLYIFIGVHHIEAGSIFIVVHHIEAENDLT